MRQRRHRKAEIHHAKRQPQPGFLARRDNGDHGQTKRNHRPDKAEYLPDKGRANRARRHDQQ